MHFNLVARYETQDDCAQGIVYAARGETSDFKAYINFRCDDAITYSSRSGCSVAGVTHLSGSDTAVVTSFYSVQENITLDIFQGSFGDPIRLRNLKLRHTGHTGSVLPLLELKIRIFKPTTTHFTQMQDMQSGALDHGSLQEEFVFPIHHITNDIYFC